MKTVNLNKWTRPNSYFGAEWPEFYVFLSRNRDSDDLTNSNYETALEALKSDRTFGEDEESTVQSVCENHWAVGWVEWIAIHESDTVALEAADAMMERLESYPVLDEDDWSRREQEHAESIWKDCYNTTERIDYIRSHRSQFEFHDLADMIGCVRGKYFAGYASELIN